MSGAEIVGPGRSPTTRGNRRPPTSAALAEIVGGDHDSPMTRGHARALLMSADLTGTEQRLLRAIVDRPKPPRYVRQPRTSPLAVHVADKDHRSRDLTAGEGAWLAGLPTDPAELSDRDIHTLAQLHQTVRTLTEQAIIETRLGPARDRVTALGRIRDIEDRLALEPRPTPLAIDRTARWGANALGNDDYEAWKRAIGARIQGEVPGLTENEGIGRATEAISDVRADMHEASTRTADMAALGGLLRDTGVRSAVFPQAHLWGTAGSPGYSPPVIPQETT